MTEGGDEPLLEPVRLLQHQPGVHLSAFIVIGALLWAGLRRQQGPQ